jgi:hypothetical protein
MLRILLVVALLYLNTALAEPNIDPKLYKQVPEKQITEIVTLVERHFNKIVDSIEYTDYDQIPSGGRRAAIIDFKPEPKANNIILFSSINLYYKHWNQPRPSDPKATQLTLGKWRTSKEIDSVEKYKIALSSSVVFVTFRDNISYDETADLLTALEQGLYDVDINTGSEKLDSTLRAMDPNTFRHLLPNIVNLISFPWEFSKKISVIKDERRLQLNARDKHGNYLWTFTKRNGKYVLVTWAQYFI